MQYVVILDQNGIHRWVSDAIWPLTREDVIGKPAWEFTAARDVLDMQTRVSRCIVLREPQRYLTTCRIGDEDVTFAVTCEFVEPVGVVCRSRTVPHAVRTLSLRDTEFMRAIGTGAKQADVASMLGLSVASVSAHEARLRKKLGIDSRAELVRVGNALR